MLQQMHVQCDKCMGKGTFALPKDKCRHCIDGLIKSKRSVGYGVEPGIKEGQYEVFTNKGSESTDGSKSDLVLVAKEINHDIFKRAGE